MQKRKKPGVVVMDRDMDMFKDMASGAQTFAQIVEGVKKSYPSFTEELAMKRLHLLRINKLIQSEKYLLGGRTTTLYSLTALSERILLESGYRKIIRAFLPGESSVLRESLKTDIVKALNREAWKSHYNVTINDSRDLQSYDKVYGRIAISYPDFEILASFDAGVVTKCFAWALKIDMGTYSNSLLAKKIASVHSPTLILCNSSDRITGLQKALKPCKEVNVANIVCLATWAEFISKALLGTSWQSISGEQIQIFSSEACAEADKCRNSYCLGLDLE